MAKRPVSRTTARHFWWGCHITESGEMDTAIMIRSALVSNGTARVRAGAGIVFDSDPAAEVQETTRKAGAVIAALTDSAVV